MSNVMPVPMAPKKQPLEALFNAMYHGKRLFSDFANADVEPNFRRERFTRSGRTRELVVPNDILKGCHEFLRLFLVDFLPLNEQVVFSYRKGLSAYDSVVKHASSKSFFVCDIANFFPSVTRQRIRRTLVSAREQSPIEDFDAWLDRIVELVSVDDCLPVGFSTSPGISNSALHALDDALLVHCRQRDLIVTRYSDDIIVSGKSRGSLEGVDSMIAATLQETMLSELTLHPGKSKFLHRGVKIKLLGMVLLPNGKVSVDASVKEEIEVLLHFYAHDKGKFAARVGNDAQRAEARLAGLLNYVNTVDQGYLEKLRKKFGAASVDYFIHRSFS